MSDELIRYKIKELLHEDEKVKIAITKDINIDAPLGMCISVWIKKNGKWTDRRRIAIKHGENIFISDPLTSRKNGPARKTQYVETAEDVSTYLNIPFKTEYIDILDAIVLAKHMTKGDQYE